MSYSTPQKKVNAVIYSPPKSPQECSLPIELNGLMERLRMAKLRSPGSKQRKSVSILCLIGNAYFRHGWFKESFHAYVEALHLLEDKDSSINDDNLLHTISSNIFHDLGVVLYFMGKTRYAMKSFATSAQMKTAIQLMATTSDEARPPHTNIMRTLRKIYDEHSRRGEYDKAKLLFSSVKNDKYLGQFCKRSLRPRFSKSISDVSGVLSLHSELFASSYASYQLKISYDDRI